MTNLITELTSGIYVDKKLLNKLPAEEMAQRLKEVYSSGKPVTIIEDSFRYFSKAELRLAVLRGPTQRLVDLLDVFDIWMSPDELAIASNFWAICDRIDDDLKGTKVQWSFADVPENWEVTKDLNVRKDRVSRSGYSIGLKTLQKLWDTYAKWVVDNKADNHLYVQASGLNRTATFSKERIKVGCQQIERYEIEQVALHFGWEFPTE